MIASGIPADYGMEDGAAGITFSNVDNTAFGGKLGDLAAKCVTERLGGSAEVIYLQSPTGQQSTEEINTAITSALTKGAPNARIVNQQEAKDRLGSQQVVSSALQGAPNANTLIGTDDEATLGGLAAFEQSGKDPSDLSRRRRRQRRGGAGGQGRQALRRGRVRLPGRPRAEPPAAAQDRRRREGSGAQLVTPIKVITASMTTASDRSVARSPRPPTPAARRAYRPWCSCATAGSWCSGCCWWRSSPSGRGRTSLTLDNAALVADAAALTAIFAASVGFGILSGALDLSVPGSATMAAVVAAKLINAGQPVWLGLLAGVALGVRVGVVNATLVQRG